MNRVDRIVELIDHALDDYGASGDAMRWTPEQPDPMPEDADDWWLGVGAILRPRVHTMLWNPSPPIMASFAPGCTFTVTRNGSTDEMVVCETAEREGGVWLTIRPVPPAESVTIDLSVWD